MTAGGRTVRQEGWHCGPGCLADRVEWVQVGRSRVVTLFSPPHSARWHPPGAAHHLSITLAYPNPLCDAVRECILLTILCFYCVTLTPHTPITTPPTLPPSPAKLLQPPRRRHMLPAGQRPDDVGEPLVGPQPREGGACCCCPGFPPPGAGAGPQAAQGPAQCGQAVGVGAGQLDLPGCRWTDTGCRYWHRYGCRYQKEYNYRYRYRVARPLGLERGSLMCRDAGEQISTDTGYRYKYTCRHGQKILRYTHSVGLGAGPLSPPVFVCVWGGGRRCWL